MGMVREGQWTDKAPLAVDGVYARAASAYGDDLGDRTVAAITAQPARFHLVGSLSCPWSHGVMMVRALKGLGDLIPLHIAHGARVEGYAVNGGAPWPVPGSGIEIRHLHELYSLGEATYTGRSTVPVLWDAQDQRVAGNGSAALGRGLDRVQRGGEDVEFTLFPDHLAFDIGTLDEWLYEGLLNGVYSAGFAESQSAYDTAVEAVFASLDVLEHRLARQRYLFGECITLADVRLFATLVRFDAIYHVLHRCCRRRLVDYAALWAYARDLFAWRTVAGTVDFDAMRAGSWGNDTDGNPHRIVAVAPDADWHAPHGREALGAAHICLRAGQIMAVDPACFCARGGE
jgi:putative glutathione S-transferase